MAIQQIPLDLIDHNPYQTRAIDLAHAQALADDIAARSLLQPPVGRPHPTAPGRYQLALGHHRLAAFEMLARRAAGGAATWLPIEKFNALPVDVRALTDVEMSDYAIVENEHRKDLSAIDKAKILRRRIDELKLTQEQAGAPFGYSQPVVASLLRLLKLPAEIQAHNAAGRLPERFARQLVTLSKTLPQQAQAIAQKVAAAEPDAKESAFEDEFDDVLRKHGQGMWQAPWKQDTWTTETAPFAAAAAKLGLNGQFPACKGCEFLITRGHQKLCARPGCFELKTKAFYRADVAKAAKALGLPLEAESEETKVVFDGTDPAQKPIALAALKLKHASLRIAIVGGDLPSWHSDVAARRDVLGHERAQLVSTDLVALRKALPEKALEQAAEKKAKAKAPAAYGTAQWKKEQAERDRKYAEQQKARQQVREAGQALLDRVAPAFAKAIPDSVGFVDLVLDALRQELPWQDLQAVESGKGVPLAARRTLIAKTLLSEAIGDTDESPFAWPPSDAAELAHARAEIRARAQALKVKLPAGWDAGISADIPEPKKPATAKKAAAKSTTRPAPKKGK